MSQSESQPAALPLSDVKTALSLPSPPPLPPPLPQIVKNSGGNGGSDAHRPPIKATRPLTEVEQLRQKLTASKLRAQKMAEMSLKYIKAVKDANINLSILAKAVLDIEHGFIEPWDPNAIEDAIECAKAIKKGLKKIKAWAPDASDNE